MIGSLARSLPRWRRTPGELSTGEFLRGLLVETRARLPGELQGFQTRQQPALVKAFYGDPAIHFEVWLHRARGRLEMGLHFETRNATRNARMLEYVADELVYLKAALGDGLEAEAWDKGWTRLYYVLPLGPLLPDFQARLGERFAQFIQTLEPVRQAAVEFALTD
jgi:hypothetical protein